MRPAAPPVPDLPPGAGAAAPQAAAPLDAAQVAAYLAHVRVDKRLAPRTLALYTQDLDKLQAFSAQAGVALAAVQPHHLRRWVAQMHARGRSGRGIALILSGWRGFYRWLGHAGLLASDPCLDIRAPKSPKPLPKALSVDEAMQLADFHDADADPWLQARDAAMVELLYGCGLRVSELTGLDVRASATARGWVDLQAAEVHVLGKGGKRRLLPLGRQALRALQHWLAVRGPVTAADGPGAALFAGRRGTRLSAQAVWQRLRQRSLRAQLPTPVHPHMLRHSFASHILQSSADLRAVQDLLGHAHIGTTQIYTRLDFQHLAQAYDAAHPRAHRKPGPQK